MERRLSITDNLLFFLYLNGSIQKRATSSVMDLELLFWSGFYSHIFAFVILIA